MDESDYIQRNADFYNKLLKYIDSEIEDNQAIQELYRNIDNDDDEIKLFFLIISRICENHFRFPYFFKKIETIILHFSLKIKQKFKDEEIYQLFKNNQRILLFLIQKNILAPVDEMQYNLYFYPEVKNMIQKVSEKEKFESIFNEIDSKETFEEKRQIGENDSIICNLIRNDSIIDFITYINQNNINFSSIIPKSIYETNFFLQKHQNTTLIEYAAFYGSIQIFQYLRQSGAEMKPLIWLYSIHGKNPDIIHKLEEDHIPRNYTKCLKEAIKCYHNDIANYIRIYQNEDEILNQNEKDEEENDDYIGDVSFGFRYYNFDFISENIFSMKFPLFNLCKFQYYSLAKLYLKSKNIHSSFLINVDDYVISKNQPANSLLHLVENIKTGEKYFIKYSYNKNQKYPQFELECQIAIKYPCIMELKGYNQNKYDEQIFLYKYLPNGTLKNYINSKDIEKTSTRNYILLLGIAILMRFLDQKHILNHQFFPDNIYINENFYPVLSEYASNHVYDPSDDVDHISLSNYIYLSPEIMEYDSYENENHLNSKWIYSYAIMFYEIVTEKKPFTNCYHSLFQLMNKIKNGMHPDISIIKNKTVSDFLMNCFNRTPENRRNFNEIVDYITNKQFYTFFENLDHNSVKKFLSIFGNEFDYLKKKF